MLVKLRQAILVICVAAAFVACERKPAELPSHPGRPDELPKPRESANTSTQVFNVKGVVESVRDDFKSARIRHEAIPNYMPAMVMDLAVQNTNELVGLKDGDVISFRMLVTEDDGWIDQVKKLSATPPTQPPSRATVRLVRDVDPLETGQVVPNYKFTNELGDAISLEQFRGKALAINFIFTTCPYPTFCPRMSQNFSAAQRILRQNPTGPTNWHFLSITIDPEKDTPSILRNYAKGYNYDPAQWSFATGDLIEITALADQLEQTFWREAGVISHNLRTAVFDIQGRLQQILVGNEWKPQDLADAMTKAATTSTATPGAGN